MKGAPDSTRTGVPSFNGRRKWIARIGLIVVGSLLPLLALEGILRVLGYGYPTSFFLRDSSGRDYITNERYAWQFYSPHTKLTPFLYRLREDKLPGTFRICVLGESAAMGTPDPAFSFSRILQVGLRRRYPGRQFEVMNAAMRGINSYVSVRLANECAGHQVDLFIIYMGNNEMSGLHAPDSSTRGWTQSRMLLRAYQTLRSSRLGELCNAVLTPARVKQTQDMASFRQFSLPADDPRRQRVYENFRGNLEDICRSVTHSGAKVLLCTVAVNLKDCPPFESKHRNDLSPQDAAAWDQHYQAGVQFEAQKQYQSAISEYLQAIRLDDHYAELLFRLARSHLATGNLELARQYYASACDWDALQFRTDSGLNKIIEEVGRSYGSNAITLVDMQQYLSQNDTAGIPGNELFHEHVHPTFSGNYQIAKACYEKVARMLSPDAGTADTTSFPSEQECADALAFTEFESLEVEAAFLRLTGDPPFLDQLEHEQRQAEAKLRYEKRRAEFTPATAERCLAVYQKAIHQDPDFWPLRYNLGNLYQQVGQLNLAAKQFQSVVEEFPRTKRFRIVLGNVLLDARDKSGALAQFKQAFLLDPHDTGLKQTIQRLEQ